MLIRDFFQSIHFFKEGKYVDEINEKNPLGRGGTVARVFANLIENIWAGTRSSFSPNNLKGVIGSVFPQFIGYAQHDSQEFLGLLLDALHEDLNRIQIKESVERPEWNGSIPQETNSSMMDEIEIDRLRRLKEIEIAELSWKGYLKRNQSIVVDLFGGLARNELICPVCKKHSIAFDPYLMLALPLPYSTSRQWNVYFVPLPRTSSATKNIEDQAVEEEGNNFIKMLNLETVGTGSFQKLIEACSKETGVPPELVNIHNEEIQRVRSNRFLSEQKIDKFFLLFFFSLKS